MKPKIAHVLHHSRVEDIHIDNLEVQITYYIIRTHFQDIMEFPIGSTETATGKHKVLSSMRPTLALAQDHCTLDKLE